ncbi:MAG: hypothetical protein AAF950_18370 [Pseudomonadota bacterium]
MSALRANCQMPGHAPISAVQSAVKNVTKVKVVLPRVCGTKFYDGVDKQLASAKNDRFWLWSSPVPHTFDKLLHLQHDFILRPLIHVGYCDQADNDSQERTNATQNFNDKQKQSPTNEVSCIALVWK